MIKLANRRGDNAPMVRLSIVLDGVSKTVEPVVEAPKK
ncbi:hypothetical protein IPG36_05505 [bacterium]|nr:MAG: hypothetical protein IPG36_05505 [bacterium]